MSKPTSIPPVLPRESPPTAASADTEAGRADRVVLSGDKAKAQAPSTQHVSPLSDAEPAPRPSSVSSLTLEAKRARAVGVDTAYERKVNYLNTIIHIEVGFGRFQWWLFVLAGFGWFVDNVWFQALATALPQIQLEMNPPHIEYATLSLYGGLLAGAIFWGVLADVIGRRLAWNATLFISSVFAIAVGGAPNWQVVFILLAFLGFGVGGNLPVDGALFLEFIPGPKQWLLTFLSVFWCFGTVFASVVAWGFIGNFSCASADDCPRSSNSGWRYTFYTLGAITFLMWIARFLIYRIPESPKYLIGKNRDEEAVAVIVDIATRNGRTVSLTVERLRAVAEGVDPAELDEVLGAPGSEEKKEADAKAVMADPKERANMWDWRSNKDILKRNLDMRHFKALFASPKMAWNTCLISFLWGLIGLAYPLYNAFLPIYLTTAGANQGDTSVHTVYTQYVVIAVCGIPGSFLAAAMVELPLIGRRGTMAIFTALTGVFLFLFTTARTPAAILGYNCASSLTQNSFYAVLYALTYEVFPAPHRGTGDGVAMAVQRVFGVFAPVVGVFAGTSSGVSTPIYVCASLFMGAATLMLLLPYESRGKTAI